MFQQSSHDLLVLWAETDSLKGLGLGCFCKATKREKAWVGVWTCECVSEFHRSLPAGGEALICIALHHWADIRKHHSHFSITLQYISSGWTGLYTSRKQKQNKKIEKLSKISFRNHKYCLFSWLSVHAFTFLLGALAFWEKGVPTSNFSSFKSQT